MVNKVPRLNKLYFKFNPFTLLSGHLAIYFYIYVVGLSLVY